MGVLVIGRRVGQEVVLHTSDGPIVVTVQRRHGQSYFHLRIDAPQSVRIYRAEIAPPSPASNGDTKR